MPRVAVNIVTHNSAGTIETCLESLGRQTYRDFETTIIDNASEDETVELVARWSHGARCIVNSRNEYYSRAHNAAIDLTDSELVLTLNPDVFLCPDYLSRVVAAFDRAPNIGSVNGKLLLLEGNSHVLDADCGNVTPSTLIDGAGLTMRRSRRPYLRGNRRPADSSCLEPGYIFGADGACGAYRRAMLEDVSVEGEYFDSDFVIYREDVDLAWRAQLLGWDCWYCPEAVAYHRRGFHIGRDRRTVSPFLRRHSVKNGWLLLLKNETPGSLAHDLPWVLPYQLKILAGLLTVERTSLGAFADLAAVMPRMLRKRRIIQERRRRGDAEIRRWLGREECEPPL